MQNGKVFLLAIILGFAALAFAPEANTTSVERAFWNTEVTQYARHRRVKQRRQQLGKIKVYAKSGEIVRSRTGKTAHVNPQARAKFQCLVDRLERQGYRIEFMGGYRQTLIAGTHIRSKHWTGDALDINQTGRNRVTRRLPNNANRIASSCGLFHGAGWSYADAGHFEVVSRNAAITKTWPIATIERKRPIETLIPIEAMPVAYEPQRKPLEALSVKDRYGIFALDDAREYLVRTATPGNTMIRQTPELAIKRLHPVFSIRLAAAVKEARSSGLREVGIFSAYRPPFFGVGGFQNKFCSGHSYGLAADMKGIGTPGSKESLQWFRIAKRHKLHNPYGYRNRAEWNHFQINEFKGFCNEWQLRKTITAQGPIDLPRMWAVADHLIDRSAQKVVTVGKKKIKWASRAVKRKLALLKKKWKKRQRIV